MRSIVFGGALSALASAVGLSETPTAAAVIDLGDIPQRPTAPEFPFERFFETRKLGQVEFAPDNRAIYAVRNDGRVTNVFAIDLTTKAAYQVTHFDEPVTEFFVDPEGRYLITVRDIEGNEAFDLYHYDLAAGAVRRLTETGKADRTTVCGLSPDGAFVYYSQTRNGRGTADLWSVEATGGKATRLLRGEGRVLDLK
jgi:Tol biopolymer transport system component